MAHVLTQTSNLDLLDEVKAPFAGLLSAFADWKLYRRTVDELEDLSPRALADLGLTRATIRATARASVYGA